MKLSEIAKVSWQPAFSRRKFGYLQGYDQDGNAKVRCGSRVFTVPAARLTFEMS